MVEMFHEVARRRGEHPALVSPTRSLTYDDLIDRANRMANALVAEGVGEGERVAYLDLNNVEFFEVMLGAAKIGAAIAPLNFRLTPGELPTSGGSSRSVTTTRPGWRAPSPPIRAGPPRATTWSCSSTPPAPRGCPRASC
jgi:long-chain acyl-CoA synthetase